MGVLTRLELDVDVSGGMIDEDATTTIHLVRVATPAGGEQPAFGGTGKMVYGDLLSWE